MIKVPLSVKITPAQRTELEALAVREDRSISSLVRRSLRQLLADTARGKEPHQRASRS
jgi:hypothetical protein